MRFFIATRKSIYRICFLASIFLVTALMVVSCQDDDPPSTQKAESSVFYDNPAEASLITSDIALFWNVYDQSNNDFQPTTFKTDYFDAGTEALELFFDAKIKNVNNLTNNLNNVGLNSYYKAIRENSLNLDAVTAEIYNGFTRLKELYPGAVYSDVVFVIGALATGGTVVRNGQMVIGTEMFSKDETTPLDGLNHWQKEVVKDQSFLTSIVIHELIHVQQANHNLNSQGILAKKTLLDRAVTEGVADYITFLVLGDFFNEFIHDFANPIEANLWDEFKAEMGGNDIANWLYNASNTTVDRPADLGYYIGFKMAEYYYDKTPNKAEAIRRLIELKSGSELLTVSEYDKKFD